MRTLVAIPVYNEEKTLRAVVETTLSCLTPDMDRILLVNDGSTDDSAKLIDKLAKENTQVIAEHHVQNQGYGASMIDSFQQAQSLKYTHVITMDCDLQHKPEDLERFLKEDPEIDIVSGSRYLDEKGRKGNAPEDRVEINRRITRRLNKVYDWNLTDSFCGFKRYKTKSLDPHAFSEKGYAFPLEFWAYAFARGFQIKEIPVSRIYTTDNRSFGEDLDKRRKRYHYYLKTFLKANRRFANHTTLFALRAAGTNSSRDI